MFRAMINGGSVQSVLFTITRCRIINTTSFIFPENRKSKTLKLNQQVPYPICSVVLYFWLSSPPMHSIPMATTALLALESSPCIFGSFIFGRILTHTFLFLSSYCRGKLMNWTRWLMKMIYLGLYLGSEVG